MYLRPAMMNEAEADPAGPPLAKTCSAPPFSETRTSASGEPGAIHRIVVVPTRDPFGRGFGTAKIRLSLGATFPGAALLAGGSKLPLPGGGVALEQPSAMAANARTTIRFETAVLAIGVARLPWSHLSRTTYNVLARLDTAGIGEARARRG
jgi:hypothetical protein